MLRTALESQTILRAHSRYHYAHNPLPELSIKSMRNGQALYEIKGGRFMVDDSAYLILNEHQPYTIHVESPTPIDSFCIFFPSGWAEDVYRNLVTANTHLLDQSTSKVGTGVSFFEKLQPHDEIVSPLLNDLRIKLSSNVVSAGWLEEKLRELLAAMLHVQFALYSEIEQMPASRAATRAELYRRLYLARDFMHASLSQPLTLDQIASIACLSPYHFLRLFKHAFGQTPHSYLTQKRIERAQVLLKKTAQPITDICFSVGFESPGSFSTLFHRYVGMSPRDFRQMD